MALGPSTPNNFLVQQANGQVYLTWDLSPGAFLYPVQRSTDGVTYSDIGSSSSNTFIDTDVVVGTQYYYQVAANNNSGTSPYSAPQSTVPVLSGEMSLGQIRLQAQQRADMQGSNFLSTSEWNTNIVNSQFELYDLLTTLYEDYYVKTPYIFMTDGATVQYTLPTDFYKLLGIDLGLSNNQNAWVTLKKFDFIQRNRYIFPQLTSNYLGVFNLMYRLMGNTLYFIPTPAQGQFIRVWYVPRLVQPVLDTDILDGISGWTEYVIVDAAIKAMQKEESDCSILLAQKQALIDRIQGAAMNRDAGQPDTISNVRTASELWGQWGAPNGDGPGAGW